MSHNLTACIFLRFILSAATLLIAGCFEDVVSEKLILEFKPETNTVVATLTSKITVTQDQFKQNRPLQTRVDTYRTEFIEGRDPWSRRFTSVSPLEREHRAWDKTHDQLQRTEHSAEFSANDLQRFFSDTGLIVTLLRGNGWDELAIYPGTSTRATQQQRLRVQTTLESWSRGIADYLRALDILYRYLEVHPDRAAPTIGALMKDFIPEERKNALDPMTEEEADLVRIVDEAMGEVTSVFGLGPEEAYSLNELSALVYDPFPAELLVHLPGPVQESVGFVREQDSSVRVEPMALWGALDGLETGWITPDPLFAMIRAARQEHQVDLDKFLAQERRITTTPTAAAVRSAIEARLARAPVYRVRWSVRRRVEPGRGDGESERRGVGELTEKFESGRVASPRLHVSTSPRPRLRSPFPRLSVSAGLLHAAELFRMRLWSGPEDRRSVTTGWRKVRTLTGSRLDNVQAWQHDGKCNRKIPPRVQTEGKGEMVR